MKICSLECIVIMVFGLFCIVYGRCEVILVDLLLMVYGLLYFGWGYGWWWIGYGDFGCRVDDWNSVVVMCCCGLVKFDVYLLSLEVWRNESGRGRVEWKGGSDGLRLLGGRWFGGVVCKRWVFRSIWNWD